MKTKRKATRAALVAVSLMFATGIAGATTFTAEQKAKVNAALSTIKADVHNPVGKIVVDSVEINDKARKVTVFCSEELAYRSLTPALATEIKSTIAESLPADLKKYKLTVNCGTWPIEQLTTDAKIKMSGPREKARFVYHEEGPRAPKGLDGSNIALWQSHGYYYEPSLNRWEWQRARIFETVEDLYPQSYVMPYLMPMLENAGAYVMSPRERDISRVEIIVDNDPGLAWKGYTESGEGWSDGPGTGFAYKKSVLGDGDNPFKEGTARAVKTVKAGSKKGEASATWSAIIPEAGEYAVYVSYASLPQSATDARYTIHTSAGDRHARVNQQMGGGTWIYLGHYPLAAGEQPVVSLSNVSDKVGAVVSADAVKIGGGMGNVARYVETEKAKADGVEGTPQVSGYPRFTEGARYWLQWAGMPESVYTMSGNQNDYRDDYCSRGLWVNYLAGGSSMNPDAEGLKIPVDLSFAFHTDAGTTPNDSIIGTLSIYCSHSQGRDYLGNGTPRIASRRMSDLIATEIVEDIRANYEPNWTRRAMWDKEYHEARSPEVPSMLLELLSHQNFADMKYGLDPTFRFTVSRAIYKGMLKFIAERDGRPYVVQPLPVQAPAISYTGRNGDAATYTLTWTATDDPSEPTAAPTYYIIEERVNGGAFAPVARVESTSYDINVTDDAIHSYRVVAGNDGGVSFPCEVLALKAGEGAPDVMIVNGFTRVSGPDTFDSGEIAGFYSVRDGGVPDRVDINHIGKMFEFRREIPWMDDDAAGFGASRADYEDRVIAGNTHDYVYTHGVAVASTGHSFISSSVAAWTETAADGKTPAVVDLILGKQKEIKVGTGAYGTKYKSFTPELQKAIEQYTAGGGSILVTGSYVATDLWDNPYSSPETLDSDQRFATDVLGYHWRVGQASVEGTAFEVPSRFKEFNGGRFSFYNTQNADSYVVESPDSFYPADDNTGAVIMRYGENNLVAGTAMDNGKYRTVVIGFPLESIMGAHDRNSLMAQSLKFLSK
ncbi:MAG: xanthan lyase [Muribaculaceae bacterium]|nr:xanthan lyase [Muribaculaceae bacterium]